MTFLVHYLAAMMLLFVVTGVAEGAIGASWATLRHRNFLFRFTVEKQVLVFGFSSATSATDVEGEESGLVVRVWKHKVQVLCFAWEAVWA